MFFNIINNIKLIKNNKNIIILQFLPYHYYLIQTLNL